MGGGWYPWWRTDIAFLASLVSFHMGSWLQQPLVGTHEEDRERQEATNENRSCLYGLMHTRLSMYMVGLPSGWVVETTVALVNKFSNNIMLVPPGTHFLQVKFRASQYILPLGACCSLICLCSCEEEYAPEWISCLKKYVLGLKVGQACEVEDLSPQASGRANTMKVTLLSIRAECNLPTLKHHFHTNILILERSVKTIKYLLQLDILFLWDVKLCL